MDHRLIYRLLIAIAAVKYKYQFRRLRQFLQKFGFLQIVGVLIVLLLSIKLLSACSTQVDNSQPVAPEEKTDQIVKLSFVVPKEEEKYWKPLVDEFNAKDQNIQINFANFHPEHPVHPTGSDGTKTEYVNAFSKHEPYDLVYMDIIWVPEFASKGWLMQLDAEPNAEFKTEDLKEEFLGSEVHNGLYDVNGDKKEELYRVPFRTDASVLFYRKNLVSHLPETFQELIDISKDLKGRLELDYGYLWQGWESEAIAAMYIEVLYGYGGFWINSKTQEVGLDQRPALQAIEFLRNTVKDGISPRDIANYDEPKTRLKFRAGEAIFMRDWLRAWNDANKPGSIVRGNIDVIPMVDALGKTRHLCKGGWGFGVAKKTDNKHQDAAIKAIKFFTSAASQRKFILSYGGLPSHRRLFFDPQLVARYSFYPKLLNWMEDTKDDRVIWIPRPRIPEYTQASCILQKHLSNALKLDNLNPRREMKNAKDATLKLLNTRKSNCQTSTTD